MKIKPTGVKINIIGKTLTEYITKNLTHVYMEIGEDWCDNISCESNHNRFCMERCTDLDCKEVFLE